MKPKAETGKIAIALHGGAGNLKKLNLTPEEELAFKAVMDSAITAGYAVLERGGTSVDAVEATIHVMEDSPLFNAGKGAVFNHDGINEMDAAIMNGADLSCGSITGVRHIRNPISAARLVMDKSEHVFLSGIGAEEFVVAQGMNLVDSSYFFTQHRWDQLQEALEEDKIELDHDGKKSAAMRDEPREGKFGTVGCVALDKAGNIAAGTSTGGLTNKRYGRIGDAPLIGAGTYANNASCAVSCTGKGEDFIRNTIAADIAGRVEYGQESLDSAVHHAIYTKLVASKGRGGCIALNASGQIAMAFTTTGMYRASIDTSGRKEIQIYQK
ncbi:MAG: isoaspartyl peptidase/L-asparaginase family protein [Flavobacteriales bacterium]